MDSRANGGPGGAGLVHSARVYETQWNVRGNRLADSLHRRNTDGVVDLVVGAAAAAAQAHDGDADRPRVHALDVPGAFGVDGFDAKIKLTLSPIPPVECLSRAGPGSPASRQSITVPESRIAKVSATRSAAFMSRKKVAMANAAVWPSETDPSAMPFTMNCNSSASSAAPSRFLRMIS